MPRTLLLVLAAAVVLMIAAPRAAFAGMPTVTLTDMARMRLQTISFFLAGMMASAWAVRALWNSLRHDFPKLPLLTFGRALAGVVLWGLLFIIVLTMISGARELMTPGAWEKVGFTYRVAAAKEPAAETPASVLDGDKLFALRKENLGRLQAALWNYADEHDGRFPSSVADAGVADELWQACNHTGERDVGLRYFYVPGRTLEDEAAALAYEPDIYGDGQLVLLTSGAIRWMDVAQLLQAVKTEERP